MKHPARLTATVALLLGALGASAQEGKNPQVRAYENGWYRQAFKSVGIVYLVDTGAEQCFVSDARVGGIAEISCRALKQRPEWIGIIRWTRALKSKSLN